MNLHAHSICICSFMLSLLLLGLITTASYFLSPVIKLNKADCIFLQYTPLGGITCDAIDAIYQGFYHLVTQALLLGLRIDIRCKHIGIERRRIRVTVRLYDFVNK